MSWMSGPCTDGPDVEINAPEPRAAFNPAYLVHEVRRLLAAHDIPTEDLTDTQLYAATIVAGDLLRALGVNPASAPERRR